MLKFRRCDKIITQRLPSAHSGGGGKASIFLCPDYPREGANRAIRCAIAAIIDFNSRPREGANPESIEIDVGFSDDTFRLRCSFQFADEEEPRELNVVISAVGVEVITT